MSPSLAKYTYRLLPLEQHHKIETTPLPRTGGYINILNFFIIIQNQGHKKRK
jgi:hypothetical protein